MTTNYIVENDERKLLFSIDFQDNFYHDQVAFYIENCLVFEKMLLTSNSILGTTFMSIKVYEAKRNQIMIESNNKVVNCRYTSDSIQLKIILNEKEQEIIIDLKKGRYIGLGVVNEDIIYPLQSEYPFTYH